MRVLAREIARAVVEVEGSSGFLARLSNPYWFQSFGAVLGFACGLGAFGVWLSFPLAFVAKSALGYVAYRQERWAVTGVRV